MIFRSFQYFATKLGKTVISLFLIQKTIPTQIIFCLLFDGLICSVCDLSSNKQLLYNFKYYLTYHDLRVFLLFITTLKLQISFLQAKEKHRSFLLQKGMSEAQRSYSVCREHSGKQWQGCWWDEGILQYPAHVVTAGTQFVCTCTDILICSLTVPDCTIAFCGLLADSLA